MNTQQSGLSSAAQAGARRAYSDILKRIRYWREMRKKTPSLLFYQTPYGNKTSLSAWNLLAALRRRHGAQAEKEVKDGG